MTINLAWTASEVLAAHPYLAREGRLVGTSSQAVLSEAK